MGFEPTISTLGKLHVDPYTKPAEDYVFSIPKKCSGVKRILTFREPCYTITSLVRYYKDTFILIDSMDDKFLKG